MSKSVFATDGAGQNFAPVVRMQECNGYVFIAAANGDDRLLGIW